MYQSVYHSYSLFFSTPAVSCDYKPRTGAIRLQVCTLVFYLNLGLIATKGVTQYVIVVLLETVQDKQFISYTCINVHGLLTRGTRTREIGYPAPAKLNIKSHTC